MLFRHIRSRALSPPPPLNPLFFQDSTSGHPLEPSPANDPSEGKLSVTLVSQQDVLPQSIDNPLSALQPTAYDPLATEIDQHQNQDSDIKSLQQYNFGSSVVCYYTCLLDLLACSSLALELL